MLPRLISTASGAYAGGGTSDVSWSHNISQIGKNRLFVLGGAAVETGGEQNPEEINVSYVQDAAAYGLRFDPVGGDGNSQEFGSGAFYWLDNVLPTTFGNKTVGINCKDSPKYAERHRGCSAYFTNVRQQAPEAKGRSVGSSGGRSVSITTLTPNALVIAMYASRNGIPSPTWGGGVAQIAYSDGNPGVGVYLAFMVKGTPGEVTITANATNPEDNALIVAAFAPAKDQGGGFLPQFM